MLAYVNVTRARKRASQQLSCWQHGDSSEVLGGLAAVQSVIQRQSACRPLFLTVDSVACRVFRLGFQAWPAAGKRHFAIALGLLLLGNCQCAPCFHEALDCPEQVRQTDDDADP